MQKVTFIKKCLYGAKGEERLVTGRAAVQYEALGLIEKLPDVQLLPENEHEVKSDVESEKELKDEVETKELKQDIETKGKKQKAKITKAPRL